MSTGKENQNLAVTTKRKYPASSLNKPKTAGKKMNNEQQSFSNISNISYDQERSNSFCPKKLSISKTKPALNYSLDYENSPFKKKTIGSRINATLPDNNLKSFESNEILENVLTKLTTAPEKKLSQKELDKIVKKELEKEKLDVEKKAKSIMNMCLEKYTEMIEEHRNSSRAPLKDKSQTNIKNLNKPATENRPSEKISKVTSSKSTINTPNTSASKPKLNSRSSVNLKKNENLSEKKENEIKAKKTPIVAKKNVAKKANTENEFSDFDDMIFNLPLEKLVKIPYLTILNEKKL